MSLCRGLKDLRRNMRSGADFADGDVFADFFKDGSKERSRFRTEHAPTSK
jgi:hypothetical protein